MNYDKPKELPDGWRIEVFDASGTPLRLEKGNDKSVNVGNRLKVSLGEVEVSAPGEVTIKASSPERGDDLAVLSFSKFEMLKLVIQFGGSVAAALILGLVGLALLVWGIVSRSKASKNTPPPLPAH